jgi:hypothetical protein
VLLEHTAMKVAWLSVTSVQLDTIVYKVRKESFTSIAEVNENAVSSWSGSQQIWITTKFVVNSW